MWAVCKRNPDNKNTQHEVMQEELSDVLPQYREAANRLGVEASCAALLMPALGMLSILAAIRQPSKKNASSAKMRLTRSVQPSGCCAPSQRSTQQASRSGFDGHAFQQAHGLFGLVLVVLVRLRLASCRGSCGSTGVSVHALAVAGASGLEVLWLRFSLSS